MKKVLVTGFEAFGGDDDNPSKRVVEFVTGLEIPDCQINSLVLPVAFASSWDSFLACTTDYQPDIILSFGLSISADRFHIERFALNWMEARISDNEGNKPVGPIEEEQPWALKSTLPVENLVDACLRSGVPAKASNHAGGFLCNYLLFKILSHYSDSPARAVFVHIPYAEEMNKLQKPDALSLPGKQIFKGAVALINEAIHPSS